MARKYSRQAKAVVTGAGSGIGRAFAQELTRRGGQVVCADINLAAAEATAADIRGNGGRALALACDVADMDQVHALAEQARDWFGEEATLVINNAGVGAGGRIGEIPIEDWQWTINVNLWGVIYGCNEFIPRFRTAGRGAVINVASMAGFIAAPEMAPYNVSKFGVVALSETLAAELAGSPLQVTTLCPTFVKTGILQAARLPAHSQKLVGLAQRLMDKTGFEPETVARQTLDGLDRGRLYVIPQFDAKLLWRAKRLLPAGLTRGFGLSYRFGR